MPNDYSYPNEPANGICDECGTMVSFASNEMTAQCPVCMSRPHRVTAGAVSASFQRTGYRAGQGVTPRRPR